MATRPPARALQPPPDLPSMPDVSPALANYLRNFSLWCRHGFADKLSGTEALPGILLQESGVPGVPPVFRLTVTMVGGVPTVTLTQVPLGSGSP